MPTVQVRELRFADRGKGALKGMGTELLVGAAAGAVVGAGSDEGMAGRSGNALIGGIALGCLGAIVGLPAGAVSDHEECYLLVSPQRR
ncbi:hypothetical protein H8E07_14275 [bacterium]|nr:hypothetical protein [bacterium]